MTLASIGTEEALASIDRAALWNFLASMRQQNGSFFIHRGGETDVRYILIFTHSNFLLLRAAYCALAVAHLCRLPALDELFQGTATWLTRCQVKFIRKFSKIPIILSLKKLI
jgi:protein farnesyltransferase subunit beta